MTTRSVLWLCAGCESSRGLHKSQLIHKGNPNVPTMIHDVPTHDSTGVYRTNCEKQY
jgi:hypothetical protein